MEKHLINYLSIWNPLEVHAPQMLLLSPTFGEVLEDYKCSVKVYTLLCCDPRSTVGQLFTGSCSHTLLMAHRWLIGSLEPFYWPETATFSYRLSFVRLVLSCSVVSDSWRTHEPGSSVYGIFQARILEWIAFPFSRGSSRPRFPALQAVFTIWATREALGPPQISNLGNDDVTN